MNNVPYFFTTLTNSVERNIKQNIDYVIQQKPVVNHVVKN